MSRARPWAERTVRGDEARLRNLRVLAEEVELLLEEMGEMDEERRLEAHGHQRELRRLLDRMQDETGPLGIDPAEREKRRREIVAENYRTNGSKP